MPLLQIPDPHPTCWKLTRRSLHPQIQQVALGGLVQKLVAVFIAGIPLVFVGGLLYAFIAQEDVMAGFLAIYGGLYHIPGDIH